MSSICIYVAPPNQLCILAALTDLSARGLIRPFGWINAPADPAGEPDRHNPQLVWVEDGNCSLKTVSEVSHHHGVSQVRMLLLVPLGVAPTEVISQEAEYFYQHQAMFPQGSRQNTRVLIPWAPEGEAAALGRVGWHNVMLSPERGGDPSYDGVPWWSDPSLIPGLAAVSLSALAGLTGVMTDAPFEGAGKDYSESVQIVKTFSRITDGKDVEDDLRSLVLHLGDFFPAPERTGVGVAIKPFQDPQGACVYAADTWAAIHRGVLCQELKEIPQAGKAPIGFLRALKWFFSFLWTSLIGAPRLWLSKKMYGMKTAAAHAATSAIFGESSAYDVIVGGVNGDGRPAGWKDILAQVPQVSANLAEQGAVRAQPPRNTSGLWNDMLLGGMSLLDGADCPSLGLIDGYGYVPDRRDVAPSGERIGSYRLNEKLAYLVPDATLYAWDDLAISQAVQVLVDVTAEQNTLSVVADRELAELEQWRQRNSTRFLPRIGRYLAGWFDTTEQRIRRLVSEIETLSGQDVDRELERKQARLGLMLRMVTILALVASVVFGVLGWLGIVAMADVGIAIALVSVAWLIGCVVIFAILQRGIFQILNRREESANRIAMLKGHLRASLDDLDAIGAAYRQYLHWASIMTAFVSNPLGGDESRRAQHEQLTVAPSNLQFQVLTVDSQNMEDTAAALRAATFVQGWMHRAWNEFGEEIPNYLTSDQRFRWKNHEIDMAMDPGVPGSPLSNWASAVAASGVRSPEGTRMWRQCLGWLDEGRTGDGHSVNLELRIETEQGWRRAEDYRKDLVHPYLGSVVTQVLGSEAQVKNQHRVVEEHSWYQESEDGLSATMILVQSTEPVSSDEFVFEMRTFREPTVMDTLEY